MTPAGTPGANPCEAALDQWCKKQAHGWALEGAVPLAVAYSAGADSTALLLAAHARWPGRVLALHVHHGLQAAADGFENQARAFCAQHAIPLRVAHVKALHATGESPEEVARLRRYEALAGLAREAGAGGVLLGQHADDQAETVVIALSRGAGLPGLAAMPAQFERHGVLFGRPLLALDPATMRAWLQSNGHAFVDDPSNGDTRFTRNRIRASLLPAWRACFPAYRETLARSARHAAQGQRLLNELAVLDLQQTGEPPALAPLRSLGRDRQANLLRHWLAHRFDARASAAQLEELLDQLAHCTTRGHGIRLKVGPGFVTRDGDRLAYTPVL